MAVLCQVGELPAKHRASQCALECCLEGIAVLDGHKSVPSREPMCPGAMSRGVRGARWTQIDAIARADMPWRPVEWRLPCQMNCRNVRDWALSDYRIPSAPGSDVGPCQMNCRNTNTGLSSKRDSGKSSNLTNRFRQFYRSLHQATLLDTKNGHLKR